MAERSEIVYEFGSYQLSTQSRVLSRDGELVALSAKAIEVLLVLIEDRGHVISKSDLMAQVWPDTFVEEINLTVHISALRKALGDSPDGQVYIRTVPKRGYCFCKAVTEKRLDPGEAPPAVIRRSSPRRWTRKHSIGLGAGLVILVVALAYYGLSSRGGSPRPRPVSGAIAILPFRPLGGETDEGIGLGMADALITKLGSVARIKVRPTASIRQYDGADRDPIAIGRQLGVEAVLDGSLQRSGDELRFTVQLVRVDDGSSLWGGTFDTKFTNLFAVQDSISDRVAQGLELKLTNKEKQQISRHFTDNAQAYDAYCMGVYFWSKRSEQALKKAVEYFQQAINKDSNYALAFALLADTYNMLAHYRFLSPQDAYPRASAAANRALELDDSIPEAHVALALIKDRYNDMEGARKEYRRAIELNPNSATARLRYGWSLFFENRFDAAVEEVHRAVDLEPLSVLNNLALAQILCYAGEYDKSVERCQKALELEPNIDEAHLALGIAYEQKGMYGAAIAQFQQLGQPRESDRAQKLECLGHAYASAGSRDKAKEILRELKSLSGRNQSASYSVAMIYAGLRDADAAFEWLERAAKGGAQPTYLLSYDPRIATLRRDRRFEGILRLRTLLDPSR
jgi:DNA-binding winged helix-turn-helix (wHTH) protein/TolB-like protein/Flp pilus assembly protein TadD